MVEGNTIALSADNGFYLKRVHTKGKDVIDAATRDIDSFSRFAMIKPYHLNSWMSDLGESIEDLPICKIVIPGTHDTGTFATSSHTVLRKRLTESQKLIIAAVKGALCASGPTGAILTPLVDVLVPNIIANYERTQESNLATARRRYAVF